MTNVVSADEAEYDRIVEQAKDAGLRNADPGALSTLFTPDGGSILPPQEALQKWVEFRVATEWDQIQGRYDPQTDTTPYFKDAASTLTPEQRAAAIKAGIAHAKQTRGIK